MDFNDKGFLEIRTQANASREIFTTSYQKDFLTCPCYGCGNMDHGFLSIYRRNGELYEEIGCPLSPHTTSLRNVAIGEEDTANIYGMSPWKFIQHIGTDNIGIARAWDQYITTGFGKYQDREQRNKYWRAIKFFLTKLRRNGSIEATYEPTILMENNTLLAWESEYSEFAGPVEKSSGHPHQRLPCRWCGANEHSVISKRQKENKDEWTCPLRQTYQGDNIIRVNITSWTQYYRNSLQEMETALDEFEFQGLGWTLPGKVMQGLRHAVRERGRESPTQGFPLIHELSIG
jgi:hypothetical protein